MSQTGAFGESSSANKLRQLARKLQSQDYTKASSPKHTHQHALEDRMIGLESNVARYFQESQQYLTELKDHLDDARQSIDNASLSREATNKSYLQMAREKEQEISSITKVKNLQLLSLSQQIQMELKNKQSEVYDKIQQEQRIYHRTIVSYQKKSQKMLMGLLTELNNQKKQRTKGISQLGKRLQFKIDQTRQLIDTQSKVRSETYRKLDEMQENLAEHLKQDLKRVIQNRRQGSDALLKMLQQACDSLLY